MSDSNERPIIGKIEQLSHTPAPTPPLRLASLVEAQVAELTQELDQLRADLAEARQEATFDKETIIDMTVEDGKKIAHIASLDAALAEARTDLAESRRMCQVTAKDCYDSEQEADTLRERNARLEAGLKRFKNYSHNAWLITLDDEWNVPASFRLLNDLQREEDGIDALLLASGSEEGQ